MPTGIDKSGPREPRAATPVWQNLLKQNARAAGANRQASSGNRVDSEKQMASLFF